MPNAVYGVIFAICYFSRISQIGTVSRKLADLKWLRWPVPPWWFTKKESQKKSFWGDFHVFVKICRRENNPVYDPQWVLKFSPQDHIKKQNKIEHRMEWVGYSTKYCHFCLSSHDGCTKPGPTKSTVPAKPLTSPLICLLPLLGVGRCHLNQFSVCHRGRPVGFKWESRKLCQPKKNRYALACNTSYINKHRAGN